MRSVQLQILISYLLKILWIIFLLGWLIEARGAQPGKLDSLMKQLASTQNIDNKIDILYKIADECEDSLPALSMNFARQALKLAEQVNDQPRIVKCLLKISLISYSRSDLRNAMEYAQQARVLSEKYELPKELAMALEFIGMIYYDIGERKRCPEYFFASLKISEKLGDTTEICRSLSRIGLLYNDQRDYKKALVYLDRALILARGLSNKAAISSILNNFATVYVNKQQYDTSLKYLTEALKISKELHYRNFEATNYLNIGGIYFKQQNYLMAWEYNLLAYNIFKRIGNKKLVATCHIHLGTISLKLNHLSESKDHADSAMTIAREEGFKDIIYGAYHLLHTVYVAKSDSAGAYRYLLNANQWKDSLALNEKEKNLASLELQYEFEKKEQSDKADSQRKNILYSAAFVVLILIILVIGLIMNRLRLKSRKTFLEKELLEKELIFKKKELTMHVISLLKRNEMLSQVSKNILQIKQETTSDEVRQGLKKVLKDLQNGAAEENMKEFMLRFKEVHEGFYDKLLARYPDLSPSDLRLCAFLRLNMTTKEISELTGQQLNSLEMARYRLRQRLGISNSEINLVTLLAQF